MAGLLVEAREIDEGAGVVAGVGRWCVRPAVGQGQVRLEVVGSPPVDHPLDHRFDLRRVQGGRVLVRCGRHRVGVVVGQFGRWQAVVSGVVVGDPTVGVGVGRDQICDVAAAFDVVEHGVFPRPGGFVGFGVGVELRVEPRSDRSAD